MRYAFKEWAVIVDALGHGDQILILRKGGLAEGRGGFQMEHREFLLLPTLFHQQRENVIPAAQDRLDHLLPTLAEQQIRFEYWVSVVNGWKLDSLEQAHRLQGEHAWREEVVEQRFAWGKEQALFAVAVRVFRLPEPVTVPNLPTYGGCKSWVELAQEIPTAGGTPVLTEDAFAAKLETLIQRIGPDYREAHRIP